MDEATDRSASTSVSTEYYSDDFESETRPALTAHKKNAMTSRSDPHPQPKYQSLPASMAPEEHWASGRAEPDTTTAVVVHSDSPSHMTSKLHRPFVSLSQVPEGPKTEAVPVWTGQLGGMKLKPSATTMQVIEDQLTEAVVANDPEGLETLLQGALLEHGPGRLLLMALQQEKDQAAKVLLKHCSPLDMTITDKDGNTPLHIACRNGSYDIVKAVLRVSKPTDVNARANDGATPLMAPSGKGYSVIVEELLNHEADPNIPDKDGWTPLIVAASKCEIDVINVLLKRDADVSLTTTKGVTALQAVTTTTQADSEKITKATLLLVRAVVESERKSQQLFDCKSVDELWKLTKSGARIWYQMGNGRTALSVHCERGAKEIAEELCRLGAPIDAQDQEGKTALMYASSRGHLEVVRVLLIHQAIVDLRSRQKWWTALFYAVGGNHAAVVQELVIAGASTTIKDKDDKDPLGLAQELGYTDIIAFIKSRMETLTNPDDPFSQVLRTMMAENKSKPKSQRLRKQLVEAPQASLKESVGTAKREKSRFHARHDSSSEAQPSVLEDQLEKSQRRIAELESRIQDLTMQPSYSLAVSTEEDLSYLSRERVEEELKKAKVAKKKSDQFAVDAKVTAQRLSSENYQLKEKMNRQEHDFEFKKKTYQRDAERLVKTDRHGQRVRAIQQEELGRVHAVINSLMEARTDDLQTGVTDKTTFASVMEAVLNGKVYAHFLLLAIAGLPGSGKSALFNSLLGKEQQWSALKDTKFAEAVYIKLQQQPSKWFTLRESDTSTTAVTLALCSTLHRVGDLVSMEAPEAYFSEPILRETFSALVDEIREIGDPLEGGKKKLSLSNTIAFLNIIDFGVNRAVYEIVPLIAEGCNRMILLNLLDLSRDLDMMKAIPDLSRYTKDGDDAHLMQLRSRLYYILYIAGILKPTEARSASSTKPAVQAPRVLLVGTHKDKLHESSEDAAFHAMRLRKVIGARAAEIDIDSVIQPGMPTINATSLEDVAELKDTIESMIEAQDFKVDMPVKWLFLRRVLHQYSRKYATFYIPRKDLVRLAQKCGITEEKSFHEFVTTFRDGGSIISCPRIRALVRNIIIDPVLFIRELDKLYYYLSFAQTQDGTRRTHIEVSLSQGIVCRELATVFWSEHADFLLEVLQDADLVTALGESYGFTCPGCESSECYFMPSLRERPYKKKPTTDTNSLFVVFDCDYVPAHIQTHFVNALGDKFAEGIELQGTDYYNATKFVYRHPSEVTFTINIIFHSKNVEIQVLFESKVTREALASVYSALKTLTVEIFTHCSEHLQNMQSELAVLCPQSNERELHYIPFHTNCQSVDELTLCRACGHHVRLSEATRLWISATYQGPSKTSFTQYGRLSLTEIETVTRSIPSLEVEPQLLGKALGFTEGEIRQFQQLKMPNCVAQMVAEWQGRCESHSRQCLGEVLMNMGHYREALWLNPKLTDTKYSEPRRLSGYELAIVAQHVENWRELGECLGLSNNFLETVQEMNKRKNERCYEVLSAWQDQHDNQPALRDFLIEIMQKMGYCGFADFLQTGSMNALMK